MRPDNKPTSEPRETLRNKNETKRVHPTSAEIVGLRRFKKLMTKHGGKLTFAGADGNDSEALPGTG